MQKESRLFKRSHNSYQHFWSRDSGIATLLKENVSVKEEGKWGNKHPTCIWGKFV